MSNRNNSVDIVEESYVAHGDFTDTSNSGAQEAMDQHEATNPGVEFRADLDPQAGVEPGADPSPQASALDHEQITSALNPGAFPTPTSPDALGSSMSGSIQQGPLPQIAESSQVAVAPTYNSQGLANDDARPKTRLQNNICWPKIYTNGMVHYTNLIVSGEPKNLDEAMHHKQWKGAMNEEYQALMKNKTWHLVPSTHATNIIDCKWVYKIKRRQDGSVQGKVGGKGIQTKAWN
jgi:hypothetical protein